MSEKTRFGVLIEAKKAEVHECSIPKLGDNQILVKQKACNICTTDYGQWMGLREHQPYPMAGGHEGAGVIVEKGNKVGNELKIGDHVAMAYDYCGECYPCKSGRTGECSQYNNAPTADGYYGKFGFAEYSIRNTESVMKMNEDLSVAEASFLEPLATVIKGLRMLRVKSMEKVVIIGAGTMGLLNAQAVRAYGGQVILTELMDKKIKIAKSMGFQVIDAKKDNSVELVKELTGGEGADAVIVAVGVTQANQQALEMVKKLEGRVLFFAAGYPAPKLYIDSNVIHYRKIELTGTYGADMKDFCVAAKLLNERLVDVSLLIETSFPLSEIQKAYEVASTPGSYRVSIEL